MVDGARPAAEEHKVARGQEAPGASFGVASTGPAPPGEGDARHGVGGLHQARAVEADPWRLASPDVGRADLRQGPRHGHRTGGVIDPVSAGVAGEEA